MQRVMTLAAVSAALAMTSACAALPQDLNATASDTALTSLCLVDWDIPVRPAPGAGADDPGNRFDTDETTDTLLAHNARLRAACPTR